MKLPRIRLATLLAVAITFAACKKEETPTTANETFVPTATYSLIYSGIFQSAPRYTASGKVEVYDNGTTRTLAFKNFKGDNGPDLKVYLSTNLSNNDFVTLGALKAVSGNFNYTLGTNVALDKHSNVITWCEDFSVLFGSAALQK